MKFTAIALISLLSACTQVSGQLPDGTTITVTTFATSRQDVDIGRDYDGSYHWRTTNSDATSALAMSLQAATQTAAKLAGVALTTP